MFRSTFRSSSHTYKLYYFPLRGRAEYIRIMLTYLNQQFEDIRIRKDEWTTFKSRTPMGQLPALEIDDKTMICQSTAIGRYIAKEHGLSGNGNIEMAKADMIVDSITDVWDHLQSVYQDQQKGDIQLMIQSWARFYDQHLKLFLERCQAILEGNNGEWMVGDKITWADFAMAEFLAVLRDCFTGDVLAPFPSLDSYVERVLSSANVKEYIAKRARTPF